MKKERVFSIFLSVLFVFSLCLSTGVWAEEPSVQVRVTIAVAGDLQLVSKTVSVTDVNGDGILTVHDALYEAHEKYYSGGAAAGYAEATSSFGWGVTKLWGVANGGSYGYYINHVSAAVGLSEPLSAGDSLYAYTFSDLTSWSDEYAYFDRSSAVISEGGSLSVTLLSCGYDAAWNPVTSPVAGASILLDGVDSGITTDAAGRANIPYTTAGKHLVSAVSGTQTLVPPYLFLTMKDATLSQDSTQNASAPKTSDGTFMGWYGVFAAIGLAVLGTTVSKKKAR